MNIALMFKDLYIRAASYIRLKRSEGRIARAQKNGDIVLDFGPSSINLMMADICNSQCIMCGHDYKMCGTGEMLTIDMWDAICGHLNMGEVVDVIYGGGGEPFMNPHLPAIAEHTHYLDPVIQHTVITNLLRGNEEVYRRLLKQRVHFLCSINAASRKTFEEIAGMDCFNLCMDNLRLLIRLRHEMRTKVDVSLSMILMKKNISELPEFIRIAAQEGADRVKVLYVRVYPLEYRKRVNRNALIEPKDSMFFHQDESDLIIRKSKELARRLRIGFEHEPCFYDSSVCPRYCSEAWKSVFINYNGDAYPCPASEILFMHKIQKRQYQSGNVLHQPIMEFWNNPFWKALRITNTPINQANQIPECSCCGNSINWLGSNNKNAHILDWLEAENSKLRL